MKNTKMKEWKENALRNAHDIPLRNDNAPVLSDYIKAFVTEREEEPGFLFIYLFFYFGLF